MWPSGVVLFARRGDRSDGLAGLAEFFSRGHDLERLQAMNGRVPVYLYLLFEQFPQYPWFGVGFQMMSEVRPGSGHSRPHCRGPEGVLVARTRP